MSNPLTEFVVLLRDLVYGLTPGRLNIWAGALAWMVFSVAAATFVYHRFGRDLAEQM